MSSSLGIYASQISGHLGLNTSILTVGGGGAGGLGGGGGGGGGAGALNLFTTNSLSFGNSYTVTIGGGGSVASPYYPTNGVTTTFGSLSSALGGGSGASGIQGAGNGGSGGGGGNDYKPAGTASGSNTNAGGVGYGYPPGAGGGGGGATAVGAAGTSGGAGNGGEGYTLTSIDSNLTSANFSWLSGMTVIASGGGGGIQAGSGYGVGGTGGGRGGNDSNSSYYNATAATSYGSGGGGAAGDVSGIPTAGYAGLAIARYAGAQQAYGGTVTTTGGYTYHAFTSSGTFYTALTVPVSGYNLWLDASDSSSITSSSNLISQWNDKSGSANNFTSSGGLRPTYTANSQNGLATVSFTASQGLTTPTFPFGSSAFTVFTVQKINANGLYHGILEQNVSGGVGIGISGATNYFSLFRARISPQDYSGNIGATSSAYDVYVTKSAGMSSGSISATAYKNGTSIGTASFSSGSTANGAAVGYDGNNGDYSNMNLAEILVYPSQLSDADRNKVEAYLRAKWRTV